MFHFYGLWLILDLSVIVGIPSDNRFGKSGGVTDLQVSGHCDGHRLGAALADPAKEQFQSVFPHIVWEHLQTGAGGPLALQGLDVLIDDDSHICRHTDAQFPESLQSALGHLVATQQDRLGQCVLLHGLLCQSVSALPADLPHMEGVGIVLATFFQNAPDGRQTVSTDAAIGPVVDAADVSQSGILLLIQ